MTSKFFTDLVGSLLPLNEARRFQSQDSQRRVLVSLKAHTAGRPGMWHTQAFDGVWQAVSPGFS